MIRCRFRKTHFFQRHPVHFLAELDYSMKVTVWIDIFLRTGHHQMQNHSWFISRVVSVYCEISMQDVQQLFSAVLHRILLSNIPSEKTFAIMLITKRGTVCNFWCCIAGQRLTGTKEPVWLRGGLESVFCCCCAFLNGKKINFCPPECTVCSARSWTNVYIKNRL